MTSSISRRTFLTQSLAIFGSLVVFPFSSPRAVSFSEWFPGMEGESLARVGTNWVNIYPEANYLQKAVGVRQRDDLLHIYYETKGESGRNSIWYRVWGGYIHSAYLQRVQAHLNVPIGSLPEEGRPVEVSMPYTRAYLRSKDGNWQPINRLYYKSVHWATQVLDGPDGQPWYQMEDAYSRNYFAPAVHLRPVEAAELAPIAPEVPKDEKYIHVSIPDQTLTAYQSGNVVLQTDISSGVPQRDELAPGEVPTDTLLGDHHITVKTPTRPMGDKKFTDELFSNALLGVPWVCFFHKTGLSLHGTFWHNNFGTRMSHGCINLRCEDALWLYRWTVPHAAIDTREASEWGTRVSVV